MTPGPTDVLEQRLRAAFAHRAATTTAAAGPVPAADSAPGSAGAGGFAGPDVVPVALAEGAEVGLLAAGAVPPGGRPASGVPPAGQGVVPVRRSLTQGDGGGGGEGWRRPALVTVAAVAVFGAGLLVGGRLLVGDGGPVETAGPQADDVVPCGPDLPVDFPVPEGFVPGPGGEGLRWEHGDTSVDVRWPSTPPLDPSTPYDVPSPMVIEHPVHRTDDGAIGRTATVASSDLGTDECAALQVTVTSPDAVTTERTLDRIEVALVGPGGPLAGAARPLVAGTSPAAAPPAVVPCPPTGGLHDGSVASPGVHSTPQAALAQFLPTEPHLPQWGYDEVSLPDGSWAYASRSGPGGSVTVVVPVVPDDNDGGGWSVPSWQASGC